MDEILRFLNMYVFAYTLVNVNRTLTNGKLSK